MKILFFILLIIMLIGLLAFVHKPVRITQYVGDNILAPLWELFRQESDSVKSDVVDTAQDEEVWRKDSTSYGEAVENILSKVMGKSTIADESIQRTEQIFQKDDNFRDVPEEPYVSESRRLHSEIEENYKKITGMQNSEASRKKK